MQTPRYLARRRPLVALVALILLLIVGYVVRGVGHTGDHGTSRPTPAVSATAPGGSATAPGGSATGQGGSATGRPAGSLTPLSSLPAQASTTVAEIRAGGPFPYRQDGVVFANAERHLPIEPRGYYHEYTVVTPGASTRGTRRIITGGRGQFYYTGDHYGSFVGVDITR